MKLRFSSSNIYVWGRGWAGRLGLGDENHRYEPTLLLNTNTADNSHWSQIACGAFHTAALTKDGKVFTWGYNFFGQLGHGDTFNRYIPTKVAALDEYVIIQIACGHSHMAALTENGEVFTWYVPL